MTVKIVPAARPKVGDSDAVISLAVDGDRDTAADASAISRGGRQLTSNFSFCLGSVFFFLFSGDTDRRVEE